MSASSANFRIGHKRLPSCQSFEDLLREGHKRLPSCQSFDDLLRDGQAKFKASTWRERMYKNYSHGCPVVLTLQIIVGLSLLVAIGTLLVSAVRLAFF